MASYNRQHLLQHTNPRPESPAKIFAKLKSKVKREAIRAMDPECNVRDKRGGGFNSPRKRAESSRVNTEFKENQRFGSYQGEVQALTLSPISTPKKTFVYPLSDISSRHVEDMPFTQRNGCTSTERERERTNTEQPHSREVAGRTPVKTQRDRVRCVFDGDRAPLDQLMSPVKTFSPMKTRERKRKLEQEGFNNVSSTTIDFNHEGARQPQIRKISTEDEIHTGTFLEDLGGRGFPADPSQMNQFPPSRPTIVNRCSVMKDKNLPMSPAKMFAYMKERESKREQHGALEVSGSTRQLFDGGNHIRQSRDVPVPIPHNMAEMDDTTFTSVPESVALVSCSTVESAHSQSDHPEDFLIPPAPSEPVLLEDPLVFNSPRISIPKNQQPVFKRNKWPQRTKFPSESVIYLRNWFLRKNHKGLFVDGIHSEDNIQWNSNIIVERVSNSVLKTISGRVYILVGKLNMGVECADSCSPVLSSSSAKLSRSGRLIKPPLEYWKGGRVILDAQMNVTIHECYDTSICAPEVTPRVSARKSQKPAHAVLPCTESKGRKKSASASDEEVSVPVRKVKPPPRKHNRAKVNSKERPSNPVEPATETISSPEESCGRTRSSKRSPAMERTLHVDAVPQKPQKASTQRSKKQTRNTNRPSERQRRRTSTASSESPAVNDETSTQQEQSSHEEIVNKRKKEGQAVHSKRNQKTPHKSQPSLVSPSSQSSENSDGSEKNRGREPEYRKRSRSRKTQKAKKGSTEEPDEDEWTEAELLKLQEAVSCYPKHMAGYWEKVAAIVGTHSSEECRNQYASQGTSQSPAKGAKIPRKEKVEAPKNPVTDLPVISARVGTLKRKEQVRQFLEAMPREDVDDIFSSTYMQNKGFEVPSMCLSENQDVAMSDLEPVTPKSKVFPEMKTPQCLHVTPGMLGSPDRKNDDKCVYQLQKRMKKNQFKVHKQAPPAKIYTYTISKTNDEEMCQHR
ncbi:hypothetical protein INR49_030764 [Caranx melampygus]|nr:hypothetical protein INR49_030764 [Caranx melampygus]